MSEKRFDLNLEACICGVTPQLIQHGWPTIKCYAASCRLTYYEGKHPLDVETVVKRWNTRTLPADVEAVVEAARDIKGLREFEMRTDNEDLIAVFAYLQKLSAAIRNYEKGRK